MTPYFLPFRLKFTSQWAEDRGLILTRWLGTDSCQHLQQQHQTDILLLVKVNMMIKCVSIVGRYLEMLVIVVSPASHTSCSSIGELCVVSQLSSSDCQNKAVEFPYHWKDLHWMFVIQILQCSLSSSPCFSLSQRVCAVRRWRVVRLETRTWPTSGGSTHSRLLTSSAPSTSPTPSSGTG